jgi:hypothetical protein
MLAVSSTDTAMLFIKASRAESSLSMIEEGRERRIKVAIASPKMGNKAVVEVCLA